MEYHQFRMTLGLYSISMSNMGPVWHSSASPVELFFEKQLHEQLYEQGRAVFLQLHHVLNSVRESFQRSWPESWAESWSFGY
jgi:TRAP-type mannitol/chloroaromatic compound transport system substrate-binding protein